MEQVRFGIIGIGNMGTGHLDSLGNHYIENAVVTAVCDIRPERLDYVRENFPGVNALRIITICSRAV